MTVVGLSEVKTRLPWKQVFTLAKYNLDVIIFATGYDTVTGSLNRIDITGVGRTDVEGQICQRAPYLHGHSE